MAVAFTLLAILAIAGWMRFRSPREYKYPPPVIITITQSNTPLYIVPGQSTLFVLPDGSFWRWGMVGAGWQPGIDVPQPVGHNHDWVRLAGAFVPRYWAET